MAKVILSYDNVYNHLVRFFLRLGDDLIKAATIKDKMKKNLEMAQERVTELCTL